MNRIAIHPYMTMFGGTNYYLKKEDGRLSSKEAEKLQKHLDNAEKFFSYDGALLILINELRSRAAPV